MATHGSFFNPPAVVTPRAIARRYKPTIQSQTVPAGVIIDPAFNVAITNPGSYDVSGVIQYTGDNPFAFPGNGLLFALSFTGTVSFFETFFFTDSLDFFIPPAVLAPNSGPVNYNRNPFGTTVQAPTIAGANSVFKFHGNLAATSAGTVQVGWGTINAGAPFGTTLFFGSWIEVSATNDVGVL